MSGIILSKSVRTNLLSLQQTSDLIATTQNRLATGKRVNSALDNPSNFFVSSSLNNRANDLNSLLDSIGQATKTLEAADKGITSMTKLVESAKSLAKQARGAPLPTSTYAAVSAQSTLGAETIGSRTGSVGVGASAISVGSTADAETLGSTGNGSAISVANSTLYSFTFNTNGGGAQTVSYTSDADATYAEILAGLQSSFDSAVTAEGLTSADVELVANAGGDGIRINALQADVDIVIGAGAGNSGLSAGTYNSTSLLDNIVTAGGVSGTANLLVSVNGGANQTITFGTGSGQVSTLAELDTALDALTGGVSASATGSGNRTIAFAIAAGETNSLTLGGDAAALDVLNLTAATTNSQPTLGDLGLGSNSTLTISVNGSAQSVAVLTTDRVTDVITKLQANATLNDNLTFSVTSGGNFKIDAKNADVDFDITANAVQSALGLTSGAANSTSLLDNLIAGGGSSGSTLTIAANGGATQTITFGTGTGQISTLAELNTAVSNLSGVTGTVAGTALNFSVASGSSATSLTIGGTAATALGLTAGTTSGAQTVGAANTTRSTMQSDYNGILTQIDQLAKDAGYNGVNLLNGDNLVVTFNETGTSSSSISGVTFNSAGLGLTSANGTSFQSDANVDAKIASLDTALTSLRTQAAKFGSSLTTVQTRQDFTKNLISTLKSGADALVLADTNEEGANLLSLQTRQQLSQTALSLATQADQSVLRLFG